MTTLSPDNLDAVIQSLRSKLDGVSEGYKGGFLLLPKTIKGAIDRNKYRGRGRPRDTDYERIDTLSLLQDVSGNNSHKEDTQA